MTTDTIASSHTSTTIARYGVTFALVAGVTWLALSVDSIINPTPQQYRDVLFVVPWAASAAVLSVVHHLQRHAAGRLGRFTYWTLMVTMTVAAVANLGTVFGWPLAGGLSVAGPIFTLAMIGFGVATGRAGVFSWRVGVAIATSQILVMVAALAMSPWLGLSDTGAFSGAFVHGLVFLGLGRSLQAVAGRASAAPR